MLVSHVIFVVRLMTTKKTLAIKYRHSSKHAIHSSPVWESPGLKTNCCLHSFASMAYCFRFNGTDDDYKQKRIARIARIARIEFFAQPGLSLALTRMWQNHRMHRHSHPECCHSLKWLQIDAHIGHKTHCICAFRLRRLVFGSTSSK